MTQFTEQGDLETEICLRRAKGPQSCPGPLLVVIRQKKG